MGYFNDVYNQFRGVFGDLPLHKRVFIGFMILFAFGGIGFMYFHAQQPDFVAVFRDLNPSDAGKMDSIVRSMNVTPKWSSDETTLMVPRAQMHEVRMMLAREGLPNGGEASFDDFSNLGAFVGQEVISQTKLRVREGELAKSIMQIDSVKSAKVMLALPDPSPFLVDKNQPKASVVVNLRNGSTLSRKNVQAVIHMVSHSIDGLTGDRVSIVDGKGNLLKGIVDEDKSVMDQQMAIRRDFEDNQQKRIQTMFDQSLGKGRSVIRVSADLDFTQQSETINAVEEGSGVPVSTTIQTDTKGGVNAGPGGTPGVSSAIPGETEVAVGRVGDNQSYKSVQQQIFEVTKTQTVKKSPSGTVSSLSVAAVVDWKHVEEEDKDGNATMKRVAWTDEEKDALDLEGMIRAAGNIDPENEKNQIRVSYVAFVEEEEVADTQAIAQLANAQRNHMIINIAKWSVVGFVSLLFLMFFLRPMVKTLAIPATVTAQVAGSPGGMALPDSDQPGLISEVSDSQALQKALASGEDPEEVIKRIARKSKPEQEMSKALSQEVSRMAQSNPDKAAQLLKKWMDS